MSDDSLLIDEDDRYSRLRLIAWWDQQKLSAAKVLVVGAGALGNEVLKNLALLGVGSIYLVDFDAIEESNLTRSVLFRQRDCGRDKAIVAAEMLQDINPDTQIVAARANIITDVGLGLFRDVDVVIGCLDNREARLWVNRQCWKVGTPWVDGGIQEINGVCKVFVPPHGACYECAMTETDYRLINLRYSCPLLRQEDLLAGKVPTAPTISSMIGGMQAQEALKLIHGMEVSEGHALVYNGVANNFYKTKYQHREDCLSHETYPEALALPLSARRDTAADLFEAVATALQVAGPLKLELDRDLVVSLDCQACGAQKRVMRPLPLVSMREAECAQCGELSRPNLTHVVESTAELAGEKLEALGIPAYDIVRVFTEQGEQTVLLAGDADAPL
ncbi:MAG TPA: thiamine biosynthesis protein ThiF [Planctomycetaceae bacterium]|nr:thiamine biosynthesis protein ThiF [Blastopirellula sp.]HAY80804.1 thiamine biosynthesis protein ThiF [Planctomycetaceae bacterium]